MIAHKFTDFLLNSAKVGIAKAIKYLSVAVITCLCHVSGPGTCSESLLP